MTVILRIGEQVPQSMVDTLQMSDDDAQIIEFTDDHMQRIAAVLQEFANPYGASLTATYSYGCAGILERGLVESGENTSENVGATVTGLLRNTLQRVMGFSDTRILVATHNGSDGSKFVSDQQFWYIVLLLRYDVVTDGLFANHFADGQIKMMTKADLLADLDQH